MASIPDLATHRAALAAVRLADVVDPRFAAATAAATSEKAISAAPAASEPTTSAAAAAADPLGDFLLEHCDATLHFNGILHFPLLSTAGAELLLHHARELHAGTAGLGLSMHRYGYDARETARALLSDIADAMQPILARVYGGLHAWGGGGCCLVLHGANIIGYGAGRDSKLAKHVDDSTYTVNLCLGAPGIVGTDLVFYGNKPLRWPAAYRRAKPHDHEVTATPAPGWAMVHLGSHPHQTMPLVAGERFNVVIWYHEKKQQLQQQAAETEVAAEAGADSVDTAPSAGDASAGAAAAGAAVRPGAGDGSDSTAATGGAVAAAAAAVA